MSNFDSWWQNNVKVDSPELKAAWKNQFLGFNGDNHFPQGTLQIDMEVIEGDFTFWLKRAFKRKSARLAKYDRDRDDLIDLHMTWCEEEGSELSSLALTQKGSDCALFLDRDGIINVDKSYVFKSADIEFVPDIEKIIQWANEKNWKVIVLTNQSGVGRGLYNEEDVLSLHQWMAQELEKKSAIVDGWYYSPYHPESTDLKYKKVSYTRKPNPAMALMASEDWSIDLSRSVMIGDKVSDILAHLDLNTYLIKGNYPLGAYSKVFTSHLDLLEELKKEN